MFNRFFIIATFIMLPSVGYSAPETTRKAETVGAFFDNASVAVELTCKEQGFLLLCSDLAIKLKGEFFDFCRDQKSRQRLNDEDFESCRVLPVSAYHKYQENYLLGGLKMMQDFLVYKGSIEPTDPKDKTISSLLTQLEKFPELGVNKVLQKTLDEFCGKDSSDVCYQKSMQDLYDYIENN